MEERDIVTHEFWSNNERFADIINAGVFLGKQVLSGEKLKNEDGFAGTTQRQTAKRVAVHKYRDIIKKVAFGSKFVLIGIENQSDIHYAMPVRIMGYDFLGYDRQLREVKKDHRRKKDLSGAEYVSGFSQKDKLNPIFTQVLYYGEKPWDGPDCLSDMLDWSEVPRELREKVADYPIHVLDVRHFKESENLKTDARVVFGFLQRQDNGKELKKYMEENAETFSSLCEDAYDMITVLTNSKELMDVKLDYENKKGKIDMCEAMKQWKEEERAEGENLFAMLTEKLLNDSRTEELLRATGDRTFRESLYREYGLKSE